MTTRSKTLLVGFGMISLVLLAIVSLWAGATFFDGWFGDVFRAIAGFFSTPFIMESVLATAGLFLVLIVNSYRRQKDAEDEYIHPDVIAARSEKKKID